MLVRFVVPSMKSLGIIRAINLCKEKFSKEEEKSIEEIFTYYNTQLPIPERFHRSKNKHAKNVAISWFKDNAKKQIELARKLCEILERCNIMTEMISTNNPGKILYEDEYQVVAIPF